MTATGAFAVVTGTHTGRSAADKFVVRDRETEDTVWWDNAKDLTPVRVYCEYAWHALFISHLLVVPAREQLNRLLRN